MNNLSRKLKSAILTACSVFVSPLLAATYYVSTTGNDAAAGTSVDTAFLTVDKAISTAKAEDEIHVESGTYTTTTEWGPNLVCKLVGLGETRDDVIIQAGASYRTIRLAKTAVLTNVTIIGNTKNAADKGGAIELTGGQVIDCVIKDGTAKANGNLSGGNVYMTGDTALLKNCLISGGNALKRGGNVYVAAGRVENCVIKNGNCSDNIGGNMYAEKGTITQCTFTGGKANSRGGNIFLNGPVLLSDSTIQLGKAPQGGNIYALLTAVVSNSQISAGIATSSGGNVYLDGSAKCLDSHLDGGTLTAKDAKGANLAVKGSALASRCQIFGGANENYDSGSVYLNGDAILEDCLIQGASCGGILNETSTANLGGVYNTTIIGNNRYGIWNWGENKRYQNMILFDNYRETPSEDGQTSRTKYDVAGNKPNLINCAVTDDTYKADAFEGLVLIANKGCFADYDHGDFRPASLESPLVDAGAEDPRVGPSQTDLDGNKRIVGQIDIGCYEYQKIAADFSISGSTSYHPPATITFEGVLQNNVEGAVSYTWDFGDGSAVVVTETSTVQHEYTQFGVYTVTCTIRDTEERVYTMTKPGFIGLYDEVVWVNSKAEPRIPYNTRETGLRTLAEAVAIQDRVPDGIIKIEPGRYTQNYQISVTNTIQIIGQGEKAEDVILENTGTPTSTAPYCRLLEVTGGAKISNLVLENGSVSGVNGGCLWLTSGVISNCVIRGGSVTKNTGSGAVVGGTALMTHCVVTNNTAIGTGDESIAGAAVLVPYGGQAILSNTLIAHNTYTPTESETPKNGTAGLMFGGYNESAVVENCTIAGNVVNGKIANASAGLVCTSWSTTFRNTVIAGNYETGNPDIISCARLTEDGHINIAACVCDGDLVRKGLTIAQAKDIFKNVEKGNYMPIAGKALANTGVQPKYVAEVDLAGKPRVFGKAIDIGCYETQSLPGFKLIIR